MNPEPFRIEPTFSLRIWGAYSLAPLYPEKTNLPEPVGEAWLTDVNCRVVSGAFSGKTLGDVWRAMPTEWRGSRFTEAGDFPLLVKFIFPTDKLSIQVHPSDAYASVYEREAGGRGKTEMWHVASAEADASVLLGLKPGVTKDQFLASLENHRIEGLFERHSAAPGDTFFVPAGTPHTIGPGLVICEVQQYSDLTYRVYDYGRTDAGGKMRELHLQKALDVLRFGSQGAGCRTTPAALRDPSRINPQDRRALLCACQYFASERFEFAECAGVSTKAGAFSIVIVLSGRGNLGWPGGAARYETGQCWLFPASLAAAEFHALQPTTLLRAYVPDLAVLQRELHDAGFSAASISQVVFS